MMRKTENLATSLGDRHGARSKLALEFVLEQPYSELRKQAHEQDLSEEELLHAGQRIFEDLVRLDRGEIDVLRVPERVKRLIAHTPEPTFPRREHR